MRFLKPILIRSPQSLRDEPGLRLPRTFLEQSLYVSFLKLRRWGAMNSDLLLAGRYPKEIDPLVIAFVSTQEMKGLCRHHYSQKKITDVLSFPHPGDQFGAQSLGEIVICLDYAHKSAIGSGVTLRKELLLLCAHGVLHLLGYQHEGRKLVRAEEMFELQNKLLENLEGG